jgi:vancomycin permeability regulator SanA
VTLRDRLDAAVEVHRAGLAGHIVVSGANDLPHFDEPVVMHRHLVERGVPSSHITLDQAGVNTWATCWRARQVFGVDRAVFVTQHPYAHRAATLCRAAGIDATVLSIDPPRRRALRIKAQVREALANVKACFIVLNPRRTRSGH